MTDEEILALTEDDKKRMEQWKRLEEGVKIIAKPEEPTYHEVPEHDCACYKIDTNSYGSSQLVFNSKDVADEAVDYLNGLQKNLLENEYLKGDYVQTSFKPKEDPFSVHKVTYYSKGLWATIGEKKMQNKKMKEAYEKELKEYNENEKTAEWIENEIESQCYRVEEKFRKLTRAYEKFDEYLTIAGGDGEAATKFYMKAFALDDETIAYLQQATTEFKYVTPVA